MAKIVTIDEMLSVLHMIAQRNPDPHLKGVIGAYEQQLISIGDDIAAVVREKLNINSGVCSADDLGYGGIAAAFYPTSPGQPVPDALRDLAIDVGGDWITHEASLSVGPLFNPAGEDITPAASVGCVNVVPEICHN